MLLVGVMMLLKTRAKFTRRYAMQWHTKNHIQSRVVRFVFGRMVNSIVQWTNNKPLSQDNGMCGFDKRFRCENEWKMTVQVGFFLLMHHAPPHNSHSAVAKLPVKNHCELSIRNARQYAHNSLKVVTLSKTGCYANVSIVVTIVTFSFLGVHWHQIGCCVLYIYRCTVYHNEGVYCTWFRRVH